MGPGIRVPERQAAEIPPARRIDRLHIARFSPVIFQTVLSWRFVLSPSPTPLAVQLTQKDNKIRDGTRGIRMSQAKET